MLLELAKPGIRVLSMNEIWMTTVFVDLGLILKIMCRGIKYDLLDMMLLDWQYESFYNVLTVLALERTTVNRNLLSPAFMFFVYVGKECSSNRTQQDEGSDGGDGTVSKHQCFWFLVSILSSCCVVVLYKEW